MKILFAVYSMELGGAERAMCRLIHEAVKYHRVILVLFEKKGSLLKELPKGIDIIDLKFNRKSSSRILKLSNWLKTILKIRAILRKKKPGVVVSFLTLVNLFFSLSCIFTPVTLICSERISPEFYLHHPDYLKRVVYCFLLRILPSLYNRCQGLVVQNRKNRQEWVSLGVNGSLISVIQNGFNFEEIRTRAESHCQTSVQSDHFNIVTVARLHQQKNPFLALNVLQLLNSDGETDIHWHWIGDGILLSQLIKRATELGLEEQITFHGKKNNPFCLCRDADLFVLTSDNEGFPNVLIEALSLGLPVLSTDCPTGPSEILADNRGFLVPVNDAHAMAKMIGYMRCLSAEEKLSMRLNADIYLNGFNIQNIFSKWQKLF